MQILASLQVFQGKHDQLSRMILIVILAIGRFTFLKAVKPFIKNIQCGSHSSIFTKTTP